MSVLSTVATLVAPSAAAPAAVTEAASAWANSSFVELLASTSGTTAIMGVLFNIPGSAGPSAGSSAELDLATGGAGAEAVVGTVSLVGRSANLHIVMPMMFRAAIGSIANGTRLSCRLRTSIGDSRTWGVKIIYSVNLDSDQQLTAATPLQVLPSAAGAATVSSSGGAWTNSSWVQLTGGLGDWAYLDRVCQYNNQVDEFEVDLGTGGAGSEVVKTTVRLQIMNSMNNHAMLPGLFGIAPSTRIACRVRRASAAVNTYTFVLQYYASGIPLGVGTNWLYYAQMMASPLS